MKKLTIIFSLVALVALAAFGQFFSLNNPVFIASLGNSSVFSSFPSGCAAYYKLDEASGSIMDATGNGNTLAPVGGGQTYSEAGVINTAILFAMDNSSSFKAAVTPIDFSTDFTVSAWVKTANAGNGYNVYFSSESAGETAGMIAAIHNGTVFLYAGGSGFGVLQGATSVADGAWHHVVVTFTTSHAIMYVDGAVDTDFGAVTPPATGILTGTGIGSYSPGITGWNFDGTLDEIGLWNRALTPAEVTALYNSGAGLPFN